MNSKTIYKIECNSELDALAVVNIIDMNDGDAVVEGSAIITDYSFCLDEVMQLDGKVYMTSAELTRQDLELFKQARFGA